ncbi:MAG: hypothetical protein ACLR4Z_02150 [Butyricicoccaceae bacterium]
MTIHEGRNRQIRKMCEKVGLEVRRLKRVAIGDMPLDPKLKERRVARADAGRACVLTGSLCRHRGIILQFFQAALAF